MENSLIKNAKILRLLEDYRVIWALGHFSGLGYWDLETYMPQDGVEARGEALSKIESLSQKLFLDKDFVKQIKECAKIEDLNDYEKGIVRLLERKLKFYESLPAAFLEEFVRTASESTNIWRKAKDTNNFSLFEPYLQKIVELSRQKAKYLGYKEHPYDALLDDYEEGLTTKEVEEYFNSLKGLIVNLLNKIKSSKKYCLTSPITEEIYDPEKMSKFTKELLSVLHGKLSDLRVDVSSHPFSINLGYGDSRITTRYLGKDFARSYGSTIHEFGHALYELQSHKDLSYAPTKGGTSLIIHESQSRFWENFIGRSKEFLETVHKMLVEAQPTLKKYSLDDIYHYLNLVRPSLIRTESDEVTYHLHILIRFEIEKGLIEGSIEVKDLPRVWANLYKKYLDVDVTSDKEGVLQDVHWSQGSIGYFPTYSFGTALSAMWMDKLESELGDISLLLKSSEGTLKIKNWLRENIHQYGSTYTFKDLVKKVTGEAFNTKHLLDYSTDKYNKIYPI